MSTDDNDTTNPRDITEIAKWVLGLSGAAILFVSITVIVGGARKGDDAFVASSTMLFNALLPLLGTWVGTVLAYYFSRKNFESANHSVARMVSLTTEQKLGELRVEKEMMRLGDITMFQIPTGKTIADVLLKDLRSKLGGKITRIPILDSNGAVLYILHQSGLFKFVGDKALEGKAADIDKLTFQNLADDAVLKNWVSNIVFVSEKASVAEAKNRMEQQPGCQDLIVTKTGNKTEPMLGWMTNVDIGRLSTA